MDENALWFESARYITADEAFTLVSDLEIPLLIAFADVKFRGQYKIQLGFNESMLHGKFVEEVYLLLDADLQVSVDFHGRFYTIPGHRVHARTDLPYSS